MVAKYLPLPVSVTVSRWQNVGHRLIKGVALSSRTLQGHFTQLVRQLNKLVNKLIKDSRAWI